MQRQSLPAKYIPRCTRFPLPVVEVSVSLSRTPTTLSECYVTIMSVGVNVCGCVCVPAHFPLSCLFIPALCSLSCSNSFSQGNVIILEVNANSTIASYSTAGAMWIKGFNKRHGSRHLQASYGGILQGVVPSLLTFTSWCEFEHVCRKVFIAWPNSNCYSRL